jgi:phosphatidylserine/phosphatidylglycerophosphate/cardiolipin synthase-like enzyme
MIHSNGRPSDAESYANARRARRILVPGETCLSLDAPPRSGLFIDARDYYAAFYLTARKAERYILLAGWQFDSEVPLLRGEDEALADRPPEEGGGRHRLKLLSFLNELCETRPDLRIFILAWDFSLPYALEREWLQRIIFDWSTNERLSFVFDSSHPVDGCHHQKFVVVDGACAFVGGIDLCDHRWDDRRHTPENPARVEIDGMPYTPYHDVQAYVEGRTVEELEQLFVSRWRKTGHTIELPPATTRDRSALAPPPYLVAFPACEVALSRTLPRTSFEADGDAPRSSRLAVDPGEDDGRDGAGRNDSARNDRAGNDGGRRDDGRSETREIEALVVRAIEGAEALVYIENQYVSSHAVARAFARRMRDPKRPKLDVVIVLPKHPENVKEQVAVGLTQANVLSALRELAEETGHRLALLNSVTTYPDGSEHATYIHSKLMIVDDRFLTVGSANLTNRSMGTDSETNLSWEAPPGESPALRRAIRRLRVSLLAEHAGLMGARDIRVLVSPAGLAARMCALAESKRCRLRTYDAPPSADSPVYRALKDSMLHYFDPAEPILERELDAAGGLPELLVGTAKKIVARVLPGRRASDAAGGRA